MKKVVNASVVVFGILFVMAMFLGVLAKPALADPPQNVKLQILDDEGKALAVTITHPSDAPMVNFIKSVEIKVNGKSYATFTYNRQPRKKTFTYMYDILPIESGYTIEVTAESSMMGSKTAKIVVP